MRKKGVILPTACPEDQAPKSGSGGRTFPRIPSEEGGTGGKEVKVEEGSAKEGGTRELCQHSRGKKNHNTNKTMREKETKKGRNGGK